MRVKGLLAGDKFKGHEYINWITDKHSEYRKQIGIDRYKPYSIEEEKQFENYLIGVERGGVGGSSDN